MTQHSYFVRERTIEVAQKLLLKVGLQVTEIRDGDRVTLDIVIPADSPDPHGGRLRAALEA